MTQNILDLESDCELLCDVQPPSLSSIYDSMSYDGKSYNVELQTYSHSDSEEMSKKDKFISNAQGNMNKRKSISLMDVSKIEGFTENINKTVLSWDAFGSRSSDMKSRDSGYNQSWSLLSINSESKLYETLNGKNKISTAVVECDRLKKELEYKEVMINTLQESNSELRMKCAKAENKISELRLKCEQHCNCCNSKKNTEEKQKWCNSPNPLFSTPVFPFMGYECKEQKICQTSSAAHPISVNSERSDFVPHKCIKQFEDQEKSSSSINSEDELLNKVSQWQETQKAESECFLNQGTLWEDYEENGIRTSTGGAFKTWGDCAIRVSPKFISQPTSQFEKQSFHVIEHEENKNNKSDGFVKQVSCVSKPERNGTAGLSQRQASCPVQPGGNPLRVVYSSPLPSHIKPEPSLSSPRTDNLYLPKVESSKLYTQNSKSSVNLPENLTLPNTSVSSIQEFGSSQRNTKMHPMSSVLTGLNLSENIKEVIRVSESSSYSVEQWKELIKKDEGVKGSCATSVCADSVSKLGLTVAKTEESPHESTLNQWNELRNRLGNLTVPLGIKPISETNNITFSVLQSSFNFPKQLQNEFPIVNNSRRFSARMPALRVPSILSNADKKENPSSLPSSQASTSSLYDCLMKAEKYANELSLGLSRLPTQLDYIQNIGKQ